jgi:8-oxo-dGTP pyrophosphatase MutT (NUDIX family)
MSLDLASIRALTSTFSPVDDDRTKWSLDRVEHLLDTCRVPFLRSSYDPGHITASGLVLTPRRDAVLLVYHERLARWLQPGGHIEPSDTSVVDAARREVIEETGIRVNDVAATLVAIDVHEIPATEVEPTHLHHDFMFRFLLRRPASPAPDHPAVWCAIPELERYNVDEPLHRGVARALTCP